MPQDQSRSKPKPTTNLYTPTYEKHVVFALTDLHAYQCNTMHGSGLSGFVL
ncbi:hypothetical protein BSTEL_0263 [Bifidobacterium stellenboschense]|uniref:Uncharacterized protein n=1 Tax=Bifidobacterium stellenboschense TaxID=762211 RepID=A0A087DPU2_9BIFI|nr:hypothetical protein BSTEL_0263 [Bifidobacterium stellenboschense]